MSSQPMIVPLSEQLARYESAVYRRQMADAMPLLHALLEAVDTQSIETTQEVDPDRLRLRLCTRMAAAITAHVQTPGFQCLSEDFFRLCQRKRTLEAVLALSGFAGAEHLMRALSRTTREGFLEIDEGAMMVVSPFCALDELPEPFFQALLQFPPAKLLPLVLGWLSCRRFLTPLAERRREALIAQGARLEETELPGSLRGLLTAAWFYCTYAETRQRDAFKRSLNKLWLQVARQDRVQPRPLQRRSVERPTLVVLAERWSSNHAMFRSYGADVDSLHSRFRTVLIVDEAYCDEAALKGFDETIVWPDLNTRLRELAGKLIKLAPDLIYYPSLGMCAWTQAMCNQRFAPIQFMSLGHPASSMSEVMDYVLLQQCHADAAESLHERVVVRKATGRAVPYGREVIERPSPALAVQDGVLNVAVNSALMKLSYRLIEVCKRLDEEAGRPLHFHFFPAGQGFELVELKERLARELKRVTVHPSMPYPRFMATLAGCQLALAGFPFGNSNSTVDTCLLGIPVVAYQEADPRSLGDRRVLRELGLPEWLLTGDDETYFQTALRLIRDDALRQEVGERLNATPVGEILFGSRAGEARSDFAGAVDWIHRNHESMQASPRRVFQVEEAL